MKQILAILLVLSGLIYSIPTASAYGTGGFPPGYVDNPFPKHKLECTFIVKELRFVSVRVPRCKVIKIESNNKSIENNVKERFNDLLGRIKNGGR